MKTIFILDDKVANIIAAKEALDSEYKTYAMTSAERMFQLLENLIPDLILLDINIKEMDGFEVIKILKSNPRTKEIPIIFLTASKVSEDITEESTFGAIDYIFKPFPKELLLQRVNYVFEKAM